MALFRVNSEAVVSLSTIVEAKDKKEARALAQQRPYCTLVSPSRSGESEKTHWCHSGEIDGELKIIEIYEDA